NPHDHQPGRLVGGGPAGAAQGLAAGPIAVAIPVTIAVAGGAGLRRRAGWRSLLGFGLAVWHSAQRRLAAVLDAFQLWRSRGQLAGPVGQRLAATARRGFGWLL